MKEASATEVLLRLFLGAIEISFGWLPARLGSWLVEIRCRWLPLSHHGVGAAAPFLVPGLPVGAQMNGVPAGSASYSSLLEMCAVLAPSISLLARGDNMASNC